MNSSLNIAVERILEKPMELCGTESITSFPLLGEMQASGECRFLTPVSYDLKVAREYDHIRVSGSVEAEVEMTCSRCAQLFNKAANSVFTIIFRKAGSCEEEFDEETELSAEDLISSTYVGEDISLVHEIEEQLAMSLPLKPLCNTNCKGLCPVCGADLNKVSCSCSEKAFNFKFSALKDFKVNK